MIQHPARLYTLGPAGTFSDRAAQRMARHLRDPAPSSAAAGGTPEIVYTRTIPEVLQRCEEDPQSLGVFPIENSDTGTIVFAQDSLVRHQVAIEWEINVPVRFSLLAGGPLEQVSTLYSQPVAYDQISSFLAKRMPQAQVSFTPSNTDSAERFLAAVAAGEAAHLAAVVPDDLGEAHPQHRAAADIQNYEHNTTRFLVVRASHRPVECDFSRNKSSILIEPEDDRPGLLYDLLSVFKLHGLNLCRLESRPAKVRPWTYVFFLDFNNDPARSAQAIEGLRAHKCQITVLGSFDTLA